MAKRSTRKRSSSSRSSFSLAKALLLVGGLLLSIFVTMLAVSQPTEVRKRAASCNDNGCKQVQVSGAWMIINCQSSDPDGDQQLCSWKGRVGQCGGKQYCCPAAGAQWTTNMSACATATPTPSPSPVLTSTPTKTPTPTTVTKTSTPTRTPTPTRRPTSGPTGTLTPTPTVYVLNSCNKTCNSNSDCPSGLVCAGGNIFGTGKTCRNPACTDKFSCICDGGSVPGELSTASPTPEGGLATGGPALLLTVKSFTNGSGQAGDRPTISGTTEPGAKVTITVINDGVSGEVIADSNGRFSWRPDKPLSAGEKDLLVVARKDDSQGQVAQKFTVVASSGFRISFGWIILLLVIVAIGFGGYVYYKSL